MALDPVTELEALVDEFEAEGVEYAVCGGLALAVHGHPRALLALDLVVVNAALEQVWETRQTVTAGERRMTVVSREGLATMKRIAGRHQDLADLAKLERLEDEDEA